MKNVVNRTIMTKKTKFFLFAAFAMILSSCTRTSTEAQYFVNNTLADNIIISCTYYIRQNGDNGVKKDSMMYVKTIDAGKQERLFLSDAYWYINPEDLFARMDVLSLKGNTLIHDAHLQRTLWNSEIERQMIDRYHAHDIQKFILVIQ